PQPLPYVAPVPGGLRPGDTGVPAVPRFRVNLATGPQEEADVALHVNARMDEGDAVVRNSFLGGGWGHEERDIGCCSPFQRGRYFDVSGGLGSGGAWEGGQPLFDFHHRVPAGPHVDVLEIEGDVVLSYVHF
uniref:Uncharacterized protein n=1 Tax=Geospiza parvula TaxID=87175 RepID=A0A8U8BT97_GEOPR